MCLWFRLTLKYLRNHQRHRNHSQGGHVPLQIWEWGQWDTDTCAKQNVGIGALNK